MVESVARTNYRYILYPSADKPRLMQTVDFTVGTELTPDIYHDAGSIYPVAANRREQHQTLEGVGPLTISDMILCLGSMFPYKVGTNDATADTDDWQFRFNNGYVPTGFTAPSDYHEMYLHSTLDETIGAENEDGAPSYSLASPALNELELDVRREGEARMTQRWISTGLSVVPKRVGGTRVQSNPATIPYIPPYREVSVIENIDWRVAVQHVSYDNRSGNVNFNEEVEPINLLRWSIRFPELRQMVYSLNDDSIGYSSTVVKQTQPVIDLHVTATTQWKQYLERYGHFYVTLKTRSSSPYHLEWKMQAQQTELAAFEVEEDIWMATVMLTPFASFAPISRTESSVLMAGTTGTHDNPTGYIPSGLTFAYNSTDDYVTISNGTTLDWPKLWPLASVKFGSADATPVTFTKTSGNKGMWRTEDSSYSASPFVDNAKVILNWAWTPDRFVDIRMNDTGITEL